MTMTNKQAIKHLEERKRAAEEHIFTYQNMTKAETKSIKQIIIAYDLAIQALQAEQERSEGCEYCNSFIVYSGYHAQEEDGQIIDFCKYCGRPFGGSDDEQA